MLKTAFLPTHSTAYWSLLAAKIIYLFILVSAYQCMVAVDKPMPGMPCPSNTATPAVMAALRARDLHF